MNCGTARPAKSAVEDAARFCGSCGSKVGEGAFCTSCGAVINGATTASSTQIPATPPAAGSPGPLPAPPVPGAPTSPGVGGSGFNWGIVGIVGALVTAILVLVIVLVLRDSGSGDSASSDEKTSVSIASAATVPAPTTTVDPVTAARTARPQMYDLVTRMESVLTQSAAGRGQVGKVVGDVRNCTVTPNTAAIEIDQVVSNRQSVLNQLSSLTNAAGVDGTSLISGLQTAIRESITADEYYSRWMKFLYANYYYTRPIGCPSGTAPLNGDYTTAQAASGRASAAKQDFVDIFNPIAESFGLQTWDSGDI